MNPLIEFLIDQIKTGHQFYRPEEIKRAKRSLPLKRLMRVIGDSRFISEQLTDSPMHPNEKPTFKLFQYDYRWVFRCCSKCESHGDQVDYLKARFGLDAGQAIALLCELVDIT